MPKSKPTQVIVHRIELQEKERELLQPFVKGKEVEQYAKSAAMVTGAVALGAGVYVAWWTTDKIYGWMDDARDKISAAKQRLRDYDEAEGTNYEDVAKSTSPLARLIWPLL